VTTKAAAEEIRDLVKTKRVRLLLIQEHLNPKTGKTPDATRQNVSF